MHNNEQVRFLFVAKVAKLATFALYTSCFKKKIKKEKKKELQNSSYAFINMVNLEIQS